MTDGKSDDGQKEKVQVKDVNIEYRMVVVFFVVVKEGKDPQ